jgi:predicted HAD superfamily Cof-like phosphohydrolase
MSDIFSDQQKFMQACGQSTGEWNADQLYLYYKLIQEEVRELQEAYDNEDKVETLDALIDILVVTTGALHSLGADVDGAWKEVMRSNFDKVDPRTGRVTKREDGKVLKPANWEPPRLAPFIRPR